MPTLTTLSLFGLVGLSDFCHVLASAAGLSALRLPSALAFSAVKYAGATDLIYLGLRTLLSREAGPQAGAASGVLKNNQRVQRGQKYVAGGVYLALGVTPALAGKGK